MIRDTVGEILEALGHRPVLATTAEGAQAVLGQDPAPDMVILDLNMPGMGGRHS
jgi:CheY-like chemotaxis protein